MKLRVVFEPSDTAAKNMIWDERRLIVLVVSSSPAVYKFMIRSGLYERISKISERFGPFVVRYRVRGSASVILSVFVYKVICGNSRTHAVQHRTDSHMSVAYVFCVCVCVCVCGGG